MRTYLPIAVGIVAAVIANFENVTAALVFVAAATLFLFGKGNHRPK